MSAPRQIVFAYAAGSGTWILFSDLGLALWQGLPLAESLWSVGKGLAFVAITSILLYRLAGFLIKRALLAERQRLETETRASAAMARAGRLYAALAGVNEAALGATDRDRLCREVTLAIADRAGMRLVAIGWADEATPWLAYEHASGPAVDYASELRISVDPSMPESRGPTGRCILDQEARACLDTETDPSIEPWRRRALEFGIRSSAAIPIHDENGRRGALALYAGERGFFTQEVLSLAAQMGADLQHGLNQLAAHRRLREQNAMLLESESRYRSLFENNHAVMLLMDPADGSIVDANPAAEGYYGWTRNRLRAMNIRELNRSDGQEVSRRMQEAVQGQRSFVRTTHLTAAGPREVEVLSGRIEIQGRTLLYSIIHDVTEQQVLERQLLRAQRLESIGLLAGGIAHDLNNVLQPVLLGVELLRIQCKGDAPRNSLDMIESAARRGAGVVRQVLAFSKGIEGERAPVRVKDVIRELVSMLTETLPPTIRVERHAEADLPMVLADANQLHQVLLNLCLNARDAMPDGGRLAIRAELRTLGSDVSTELGSAKAGDYVLLAVSDTGQGIPPENQVRIFDPFFTTKPAGKGTGLGLPSVLGIVRGHGGYLEFDSEPGRGTEFRIFLPALRDTLPPPVQKVAPSELAGDGRLLIVCDDEESVRGLTAKVLRSVGFEVIEASDGGQALEAFLPRMESVSGVILDLMMPGVTGEIAAAQMRTLRPELPILFMSGMADREEIEKRLRESGDATIPFLSKPFTANDLMRAVHLLLNRADPAPRG